MKTITTFEDGKSVQVERYENGLKIGQRKIFMTDYILSLMEELHISDIIAGLMDREVELMDYFRYLNQDEMFSDFLVASMEAAERAWLIKNPQYLSFVRYAIEKINIMELEEEGVNSLFKALLKHVKEFPNEAVYVELLDALLMRVVQEDERRDCIEKIFPVIIKMARDIESPLLRDWFNIIVPHIDGKWLLEEFNKKSEKEPIKLTATQIPKNCVFIQTTTKCINYTLDIPKSRIRVKYHDDAYDDVGHPRLLTIVSVKENECIGLKFFSVKDTEEISENTQLYSYPYSNVYETGGVCWSGYREIEIKSMKDIEMLPLMFLSTVNNSHMRSNVRELFQKFSGVDFDDCNLGLPKYKLKDVF